MKIMTYEVARIKAQKKYKTSSLQKIHALRYYLWSSFLTFFGDILVYPYPMFVLFGNTSYQVKGDDFRSIVNSIQEGDILLRKYNRFLDGFFIPGFFAHAAYYAGKTDKYEQTVIHSMAEGVFQEDLFTFLRADHIIVLRPSALNQDETKEVTKRIVSVLGRPYDFDFDFDEDLKFSCTELVYYGFLPFKDKINLVMTSEMLGKKIIKPDDFLKMKLDVVYITNYRRDNVLKFIEEMKTCQV